MPRQRAGSLSIRGVNVYFGGSHALQGVDLNIEQGVLAVVGRNGMGKTTLCKTIMGLVRAASGSIKFAGEELTALPPAEIARLGIGYVPQGRRLWPSLSVDEHLRLAASGRGAWTIERIYDTFPRLAERKANLGRQLSGGEQQMLAIARALLANPRALIMDEPTEGLAPVIVAQVEEMLLRLAHEGEQTVLLVEQNIGVATAVSETIAIMANGRITRIIDSARLALDRDLQQRLLGVGRHAQDETDTEAGLGTGASEKADTAKAARARGTASGLLLQPETAHALVGARSGRANHRGGTHAERPFRGAERRRAGKADRNAPLIGERRSGRRGRGHARHQRRGAAFHPRHSKSQRVAHAAC